MRMRLLSTLTLAGGIGMAAIVVVATTMYPSEAHRSVWMTWVYPSFAGLALGVGAIAKVEASIRRRQIELIQARAELESAIKDIHGPNDLLGLIQANRKQMDAYDAQARTQGSTSHWISIAAMIIGLGIVAAGFWIAVAADQAATKYSAAIVAAVGTATGGYIAQTFIRLNSSTQDQVRYYFEQPLVQSYLLTAERFVTQMPESERPKQYQALVEAALKQAAIVPQHRVSSTPKSGLERKRQSGRAFRLTSKPSGSAGRD
ncbi:TRADD-N-associated membrane domain-containing protein [Nocardia miyunensis]|uniref:TRADD-N-associated membrane domain-containing protein n=1 Tax=Nocardia miyunensis TaxID=282684 RepID=UPI00082BB5BF|nr:hypothetical protein [Nocardia miyunensis]